MASEDETERRETLVDIVAQMRTRSREVKEAFGGGPDGVENMLDIWADRIEAAWKRQEKTYLDQMRDAMNMWGHEKHIAEHAQKPTVGNAAAMRDALVKIYREVRSYCVDYGAGESHASLIDRIVDDPPDYTSFRDSILEIDRIVEAALSAPARQCDVGTAAEQERRYKATGEVYHTSTLTDALAWAQTPHEAKEGGAE